jgi:hypothetical protein
MFMGYMAIRFFNSILPIWIGSNKIDVSKVRLLLLIHRNLVDIYSIKKVYYPHIALATYTQAMRVI